MLLVLVTYQDMLFNLVPERQIPADKSHCQSSLSSCALILQGQGEDCRQGWAACTGSPSTWAQPWGRTTTLVLPQRLYSLCRQAEELSLGSVNESLKLKPHLIFNLVTMM